MIKYVVATGDTIHELTSHVNSLVGYFPCGGVTVVTNQQGSPISFLQAMWSTEEEDD